MSDTVDPVWGMKLSEEELGRLQRADSSGPSRPREQSASSADPGAISTDDLECMQEIRKVLERYDKLDRFGVSLLHQHFPLEPGEVLLERSDFADRSMTLRPAIVDPADTTSIDTQWYLGQSMPLSLVKCQTSMHQ